MENVRKAIATLFAGCKSDVISLDILDKVVEDYISLDMLDKPPRNEKCRFISPRLECNLGGFGHAGCMDENFHGRCKLRAIADRRIRR